jgi:hypothetical protein
LRRADRRSEDGGDDGVRQAADAFDFAHDEEAVASAAVIHLMNADLAWRKARRKKTAPIDYLQARAAARTALWKLEPGGGRKPNRAHPLETKKALRPRLGGIEDTAKGLALLVELCACQPWAASDDPDRLEKEPREKFLNQVATFLGGDTTPKDVEEIDDILYKRNPLRWILPIVGGVGLGVVTAGFAAPLIGGAIGATMGLSGAAAVNAGLAALGGGSLAAGGLGVAGGTALIGGMGGVAGGGGAAAARKVIVSDDFKAAALEIEGRKLVAFVERLKVHDQSSQAKAQTVINDFAGQVKRLEAALEAEQRKSKGQSEQIEELEKKVKILVRKLKQMRDD